MTFLFEVIRVFEYAAEQYFEVYSANSDQVLSIVETRGNKSSRCCLQENRYIAKTTHSASCSHIVRYKNKIKSHLAKLNSVIGQGGSTNLPMKYKIQDFC